MSQRIVASHKVEFILIYPTKNSTRALALILSIQFKHLKMNNVLGFIHNI